MPPCYASRFFPAPVVRMLRLLPILPGLLWLLSGGSNATLSSSQAVKPTFNVDVAGTYTVTIDGLSDTFTVKAVTNWWFVGIAIAIGVLVGVFISRVIRRRWA